MVTPTVGKPTEEIRHAEILTYVGSSAPLYRVYHRDLYTSKADDFRHFGPVSRYDHQTKRLGQPAKSPTRASVYLASSIGVAISEVFGFGRSADVCPNWYLAEMDVDGALNILDLTGPKVMRPGAYASIIGLDRPQSQTWARKIYSLLPEVHGIRYIGSHDYGECFVLWERAQDANSNGTLLTMASDGLGYPKDFPLAKLPPLWAQEVTLVLTERRMKMKHISKGECHACRDWGRQP